MKRTVVLIDHPVGQRDDRASRLIAERGYELQWCCPGKGESLPALGPQHAAAVVYGGTENLSVDEDRPYLRQEIDWIARWAGQGRPFLGICLGGQLLARALGAPVAPHPEKLHEIGYYPITPAPGANGFLGAPLHVYQWHKEGFELPPGATLLASGETFPNQAFRYGERAYGIQFHPEVSPPVMRRWLSEASEAVDRPGAHSPEQQIADAERFDAAMEAWLVGFLDGWLAEE
ncbi:MAG: glutamine amidotransferase [Kiloniellales bacterium]